MSVRNHMVREIVSKLSDLQGQIVGLDFFALFSWDRVLAHHLDLLSVTSRSSLSILILYGFLLFSLENVFVQAVDEEPNRATDDDSHGKQNTHDGTPINAIAYSVTSRIVFYRRSGPPLSVKIVAATPVSSSTIDPILH